MDWRTGALRYIASTFAEHGPEAVTRHLPPKPLAPQGRAYLEA